MKTLLKISFFALTFFSSNLFAITLDGQLNDEEWLGANLYNDFVVVSPFSLATPEYQTETRVFTTEEGIYVGTTNFQPADTQKSERTARDAQIETDSNIIIIDFDNTAISGYHFEIGNGGSLRDGIWSNESSFSNEWNGVWSGFTSSDEDHWYSEIFIPWDVAPMVAVENSERTIGLHITRFVQDISKQFASAPIVQNRQRFLSEFITTSINDYASSSLQVFGYATARQDRVADDNSYDAGIDVFWKPNSSKQLSLSINPDFGQVESDDLVVNFSPTETFFSENRPFFTENQSLFDLSGANGLSILHTRRIGGRPDVGTEIGADIAGALKFTSVGDNFNYGFFSAIEDSDAVAEGRNYYAGRAIRKSDDYSIGYLMTYTDRPDIDREAIVQAVDYSYNFNHDIKLNGQFINTDIDTALQDYSDNAGWASVEHQISDTWRQSVQVSHYADQFDINDLGFLGRNDLQTFNYSTSKENFDYSDESIVQSNDLTLQLDHQENTQGEHLNSNIQVNSQWTFKNTSNILVDFNLETGGVDDLLTRGNGNVNTDQGHTINMIYFADRRNKFQWHARFNLFDTTVDGKGYFAHIHPSYQITDNYLLKVGFTYTDGDDWLLWQGGTQLNTYKNERFRTEIEFEATPSEKQEFSLKFEWIAISANGQNTYLVNGQGNLSQQAAPVNDFNLSDVAIQLRYRYEIAPLSNLYVVYSRGGTSRGNDDSSLSSLFSPGWEKRDGDNLIVKIRYQF